MRNRTLQRSLGAIVLAGAAFGSISCGEVARTGRAPAYIIIDRLEGASGATPDQFVTNLLSDVQTIVTQTIGGQTVQIPTFYNDLARATFRLALKNPGSPTAPLGASTINEITLTRYRVTFRRADGRNTQGVDVPYSFDGAFTVTIPASGTVSHSFDVVRHQAKLEPPLRNLVGLGGAIFITTIAEIQFWGHDQAGNEVTASSEISIAFGDFADPS